MQNLHEEPGVFLLLVAEPARLETAVCRRHAQSSHPRLAVGGVEVEHHLRVVVLVVVAVGALAKAFDHRLHAATRTAHACVAVGNFAAPSYRAVLTQTALVYTYMYMYIVMQGVIIIRTMYDQFHRRTCCTFLCMV